MQAPSLSSAQSLSLSHCVFLFLCVSVFDALSLSRSLPTSSLLWQSDFRHLNDIPLSMLGRLFLAFLHVNTYLIINLVPCFKQFFLNSSKS